jgi:hypothetical protein
VLTHICSHGSKPSTFLGIHLGNVIPPWHLYLHNGRVNSSPHKFNAQVLSIHSIHCRKGGKMREARWWTRILVRTADVSEIPGKTSAAIQTGSAVVASTINLCGILSRGLDYACKRTKLSAIQLMLATVQYSTLSGHICCDSLHFPVCFP